MALFRRRATATDDRPLIDRTDEVYDRNDAVVRHEVVHDTFGGVDVPATIAGALVALALTGLLGAVGGAIFGTTVFGTGDVAPSTLASAAVVAGIVLCISYFVGGWTAGASPATTARSTACSPRSGRCSSASPLELQWRCGETATTCCPASGSRTS